MSLILVTGATGNLGSRLIQRLAARKLPVRALVRNTDKAKSKLPAGVETFAGDLSDRERVRAAMKGVTQVYVNTAGPEMAKLEANVIEAAAAERVQHVVMLSVLGAQHEAAQIQRWHRAGEKAIEAAKLPFTILRPSSFASNALGWAGMLKGGDAVYGPYGDAAFPVIDPEDIAAVAEKVLTEKGHEGKAYDLTGPASLTTAEQVAILGKVIGRNLKFVNVPDAAARESMVKSGMPAIMADAMIDLVSVLRSMGKIPTTTAVQDVLGRPAHSFEEWCKANANAFK